MIKYVCPYAKNCEIYLGQKAVETSPLLIYKNVFCRRGAKGWNNCMYYIKAITNNQQ